MNWNKSPLSLWHMQLHFAVFYASSASRVSSEHLKFYASSASRVSSEHLNYKKHQVLPGLVQSI